MPFGVRRAVMVVGHFYGSIQPFFLRFLFVALRPERGTKAPRTTRPLLTRRCSGEAKIKCTSKTRPDSCISYPRRLRIASS